MDTLVFLLTFCLVYLLGMIPAALVISYFECNSYNAGTYIAIWPLYPLVLLGKLYAKALLYFVDLGEKIRSKREKKNANTDK